MKTSRARTGRSRQRPTRRGAGRLEKDVIQKSNMHVDGKSDGRVVPTKCHERAMGIEPTSAGGGQALPPVLAIHVMNHSSPGS